VAGARASCPPSMGLEARAPGGIGAQAVLPVPTASSLGREYKQECLCYSMTGRPHCPILARG